MRENSKFWLTIIIAAIGAFSWIPQIIEFFKPKKLSGKIISQYANFTIDKKNILLLYKISVISINQDFFLKDINLSIKFPSSNHIKATSRNNRKIVFTYDSPKELIVSNNEFLNNLSVLSKNKANVGYLFFVVPFNKDERAEEIEFEFISYNKESKKLKFTSNQLAEEKFLFDDSIWR